MNYTLMRWLDKYVGVPVCFGFYTLSLLRYKQNYVHPKRILITRFWGIGSIILASPTIKAVREKFPNAEITFLTLEKNKHLYENSGLFDKILYFKLDNLIDAFPNFLKTILILRKQKFDLAIDLDIFQMFTPLLLFLSNVKIKIGHDTGKIRALLYQKSAVFNNKQHISESFFDLVRLLGIESKPSVIKIPISEQDIEYVNKMLNKKKIKKSDKLIGVNVNCSDFGTARRWPYKNFAELADRLIDKLGVRIIFIGAPFDIDLVEKTITIMRNKDVINFAGETTLKQLAALIQKFDIFITNDSGPMHIAVAMNIPVIAFFGPETPLLYGPLEEQHIVFYKHLSCSPCLSIYNSKRINCKHDSECIKSITVDEVMEKAENYLK